MESGILTFQQQQLIDLPPDCKIFLQGPAGAGKTTAGAERLKRLIQHGVPAHQVLVLVPQRTIAEQYYGARIDRELPAGGMVDVFTFGGLAQRLVELFWPVVSEQAGFARPNRPLTFANIETAQYYMALLVRPMLEEGRYFQTISLEPNRIYSQILSNLNLAAEVGIPLEEVGSRLKAAWVGEPAQLNAYEEAQECALKFRAYCLEHNLIDFSLALEIFTRWIWPSPAGRAYLANRYRHLIYDNTEEDFPIAHDIVQDWLPELDSAMLVYDTGGGYRSFLGADPDSACRLANACDRVETFSDSLIMPDALCLFDQVLNESITSRPADVPPEAAERVKVVHRTYFPQMLDWVAHEIAGLVLGQRVKPGEIAVLAPYLTDSLRFALVNRLEQFGIPGRSLRPSRPLRDEAATHCLLTLAKLAHPGWNLRPTHHDVRHAFLLAIQDLDLVRAELLSWAVYNSLRKPGETLKSYFQVDPIVQERITHLLCQRYEKLYRWIAAYAGGQPQDLDIFLSRLFGEVLSGEGFGFHRNYDSAGVAAQLIESIQNFRRSVAGGAPESESAPVGLEYVRMIEDGILGSQFLPSWVQQPEDAVFIAPAYTYLVSNRPVRFQFWLDIGASGWWQRLDQPLTHPYVLSRHWPPAARWDMNAELQANLSSLSRLASGLVHRCSGALYLCATDISEQGDEQQGRLAGAINKILKQAPDLLEEAHV